MKLVIVYEKRSIHADTRPVTAALVAALKYMTAIAGIMGGFFFTFALWTARSGMDFSHAAADLAPVFTFAAIAYALALWGVTELTMPRRGRSTFEGFGVAATFIGSFAVGFACVKAALWFLPGV